MRVTKKIARALTTAGLALAMTAGVAFASLGSATVTADSLRLRSAASTGSATLTTAVKGSSVSLLSAESDGWYKVSYNSTEGYMSAQWLNVGTLSSNDTADSAQQATPVVTADALNVRLGAGTEFDRVGTLKKGDEVTILDDSIDGWYQVTNGTLTGYVSAQYISLDGAVPQKGLVTASSLNVRSGAGTGCSKIGSLGMGSTVTILDSVSGWYKISSGSLTGYVSADYVMVLDDVGSSPVGAAAAALAVSFIGSRYVYGAAGPSSFDCSGLSYYIYKQLGRTIARGSSGQYTSSGSFVSLSDMEPGDLIFIFDPKFDGSGGTLPTTHMGIYVGNGQFVHASTTTYRVQYDSVYGSYYTPYIVGAKRIS